MKDFASKFYQTLILNVATISAIIVGVLQFAVRSFNENNGAEKTRKVIQTVLRFVDKIVAQLQDSLDNNVPVVELSTKSPKGTRKVQ
jgi:hypothetical protein